MVCNQEYQSRNCLGGVIPEKGLLLMTVAYVWTI